MGTKGEDSKEVGPIEEKIMDAERKIDEAETKMSEIDRKIVDSLRKTKWPCDSFKNKSASLFKMSKKSAEECESRARRGHNVRSNPAMQKTARDGQRWWHVKVQELRSTFDQVLSLRSMKGN